jgi:hypothetical protein
MSHAAHFADNFPNPWRLKRLLGATGLLKALESGLRKAAAPTIRAAVIPATHKRGCSDDFAVKVDVDSHPSSAATQGRKDKKQNKTCRNYVLLRPTAKKC